MKKYDLIIWDFDGTLANTVPGIIASIEKALSAMNLDNPGTELLMKFVGPPLSYAAREFLHMPDKNIDDFVQLFRKDYLANGLYQSAPFSGIPQALDSLRSRGKLHAVATLKPLFMAETLLRHYGLAEYFGYCGGGDADERGHTTKAQLIQTAIDTLLPNHPEKAIMIGDTAFDFEGAQSVGIDFMGVAWGGHLSLADARRDHYVFFAEDIPQLVNFLQ